MRLMIVFGTRPEFLKMYPVIREAEFRGHDVVTVNTGQHREMLQPLLSAMRVSPRHELGVFDDADGLAGILALSVTRLTALVAQVEPDWVLVQGDTSATLAGALAGFYEQRPVAHIEAGLRTHDKYQPFPEEINRRLVTQVADAHFAPTALARANLQNEGISHAAIRVVGNTSIDMLRFTRDDTYQSEQTEWIGSREFVLATIHRRENLGDLAEIFSAVNDLAAQFPSLAFLCPLHLNPLVQSTARSVVSQSNVRISEPLEMIGFHSLLARCKLVITDSGGIQEEAPAFGKPVLVARAVTERPEGVTAGTLLLVGTERASIVDAARELLTDPARYREMATVANPFGDGHSAPRILDSLQEWVL